MENNKLDQALQNLIEITSRIEEKTDELQVFLNKNINLPLNKETQKKLIDLCNIRDVKNRQQKSISIISAYLQENFNVKLESDRKRVEGERVTYWTIRNI